MCNDIYKITGKCCQNFLFSDVIRCLPVKIRRYRPGNSGFRSVSNGYRFLNLNLNFIRYLTLTELTGRFTDKKKIVNRLSVGNSNPAHASTSAARRPPPRGPSADLYLSVHPSIWLLHSTPSQLPTTFPSTPIPLASSQPAHSRPHLPRWPQASPSPSPSPSPRPPRRLPRSPPPPRPASPSAAASRRCAARSAPARAPAARPSCARPRAARTPPSKVNWCSRRLLSCPQALVPCTDLRWNGAGPLIWILEVELPCDASKLLRLLVSDLSCGWEFF